MKYIESIHVELTPFQTKLLEKMRSHLEDFTEEEVQQKIVSLGFMTLGHEVSDESDPDTLDGMEIVETAHSGFEGPARHVDEEITISLDERLRLRLEGLLRARPGLSDQLVFVTLIDLGLETLIQLGVTREKDLIFLTGVV